MRKTIVLTGAVMLLAVSLLFLPGCSSPTQSRDAPSITTGTVTLAIGQNLARTILPEIDETDFQRFVLTFSHATASYGPITLVAGTLATTYDAILALGAWTLVVDAFMLAGDADPTATGTETFTVISGTNDPVDVELVPTGTGYGRFSWEITLTGFDTSDLSAAEITIVGIGNGTNEVIDLMGPSSMDDVEDLPVGQFRVTLTLTHDDGRAIVVSEILHVFFNMESIWEPTFTLNHFTRTLLSYVLGAWDDVAVPPVWNFGAADITFSHFGILGVLGVPSAAELGTLLPYLNALTIAGGVPANEEGLRALVDSARIRRGAAADADFLQTYPDARESLVTGFRANATPVMTPAPAASAWTEPTVTVTIGAYSTPFTFILPAGVPTKTGASTPNPLVDDELTAVTTAISPTLSGFTFLWQRSAAAAGPTWTDIGTDATYTLAAADVGYFVRVVVAHPGFAVPDPVRASTPLFVPDPTAGYSVTINITLDFSNEAPTIATIAPFSITTATPPTITAGGVDPTYFSIVWRRGTDTFTDTSLTLNAAVHGNRIGTHSVTLEVTDLDTNRVYSTRVDFTVNL